jgi:phosphoserine phosphatase
MTNYCVVTSNKTITDAQTDIISKNLEFENLVRLGKNGVQLTITNSQVMGALPSFLSVGLDFNFVTALDRKKLLLLVDMDGTILEEECIDELAYLVGKGKEVQRITRKAMQEGLNFDRALKKRLKILRGTRIETLSTCLKDRINVRPGVVALFKTFRKFFGKTAIVSGGFTFFSEKIGKEIGADFNYANVLDFENNKMTGEIIGPILNRERKGEILKYLCHKMDIDKKKVIAVGDGNNDVVMTSLAGLGVSFKGSNALDRSVKITLKNSDLSAILYLLGIREEAFIY